MVSGGITEVIWHFAGYLKIINDIARDRLDYDDAAYRNLQEDYTTPRPDYQVKPDIDELDSRGMPFPEMVLPETLYASHLPSIKKLGSLPELDFDIGLPPGAGRFLPSGGGAGAGGAIDFRIVVEYQPGGEQTEIEIKQHNFMLDDDELIIMSGNPAHDASVFNAHLDLLKADANSVIGQLADDANAEIPTEWWISQNGTGVTEFVKTHDAETVGRGDEPADHSVAPGYYLNGELQDPAPDSASPPEVTPEPDLGHDLGQWAEAGSNGTFNAALIVDLSESGRSMIVMGDYFKTNAIFQTNSLVDRDHISMDGIGGPHAPDGENVTDNIADFVQHPGLYELLPVTFAGPRWSVNVVEGDYYNVHTIVQMNYLSDNDVIVQKSSDTHYEAHTGENELGNLAEIFNGTIHYDLIIVAGTYHGLNVIFQNNILLNDDVIKLLSPGTDPGQIVISGENELTNTAAIEIYGDEHFLTVDDSLSNVFSALSSGLTAVDPSYGTFLDGSGGVFDVLYVKGDYYDINAIWQTNVVSDINIILQILEPPSVGALELHPEGAETQSVTSGKNFLNNDAAIVDVGATKTFVNGEVYGDSILVQANLLPTDKDQTLVDNMHALVPELIAFVNDSQEEAAATAPAAATPPTHDDPIANIMH